MVEEGIQDCIKNGKKEEKWRRIARFRVENEMREGKEKEERQIMTMRLGRRGMETHIGEMYEKMKG